MNAKLYPYLPKEEYDELVPACDVGLILLDPRFTIPNFPSRLLTYMEFSMPVCRYGCEYRLRKDNYGRRVWILV